MGILRLKSIIVYGGTSGSFPPRADARRTRQALDFTPRQKEQQAQRRQHHGREHNAERDPASPRRVGTRKLLLNELSRSDWIAANSMRA
jgi:hypothetical protein